MDAYIGEYNLYMTAIAWGIVGSLAMQFIFISIIALFKYLFRD